MQNMQRNYKNTTNLHSRSGREPGYRNDNPNCYWLLRWKHEMNDKPNWMTDIRRKENQSKMEQDGEDSTILKWKYNKQEKCYQYWCKKDDSNVLVRIAAVNWLPNFVSPTNPLYHKREHNTRNTPSHYYLKAPLFCDREPLQPVLIL